MDPHDRRIMHSSNDANWRTPSALFQALDEEFNFVCDAAADETSTLCRTFYGPGSPVQEDALAGEWGCGLNPARPRGSQPIFLNPPYSRTLARTWNGTGQNPYEITCWAEACRKAGREGLTVVGLLPFTPQTCWYRWAVWGLDHTGAWNGYAATEERRLPHRVGFLRPDGSPAGNAGVNSVVIVWRAATGIVGPWTPQARYWSYR